jgi:hypothetical protein
MITGNRGTAKMLILDTQLSLSGMPWENDHTRGILS